MPHFSAWYKNWGFFHQSPPQKKINSAPEWIKYNFHFSVLWCLCFSLLHPFSAILFLLLLCRQEKWLGRTFFRALNLMSRVGTILWTHHHMFSISLLPLRFKISLQSNRNETICHNTEFLLLLSATDGSEIMKTNSFFSVLEGTTTMSQAATQPVAILFALFWIMW